MIRPSKTQVRTVATRVFVVALAALCVAVMLHLLYSAWCAFTWGKFRFVDYGKYVNMIWNTGHGRLFRYAPDQSYLRVHLSFTLALIGPLFRTWDHPFLLSVVQWTCMSAGGVVLAAAGRRRKLDMLPVVCMLFFFVAYRFTQAVMLSEYHGVSMYLLLIPWLYYCLSLRPGTAWLPLMLFLGVREDAFLYVLPMLGYYAFGRNRCTARVLSALAVAYGVLAIWVLYPAINGVSLFAVRGGYIGGNADLLDRGRLVALATALLPLAVVSGRGALPAFLFPSAGLAISLFSGSPVQRVLGCHYSAPVMACMAVGLVESLALRQARVGARSVTRRCLALVLVTLAVHAYSGFLPLGGKPFDVYARRAITGEMALRAARHVPRDGLLVTEDALVAFVANRAAVLKWGQVEETNAAYDVVFAPVSSLHVRDDGGLLGALADGSFGLRYDDGMYAILERGYDPAANRAFLDGYRFRPVVFAATAHHGGSDRWTERDQPVRYWEGAGHRGPINLSYGAARWLQAGHYRVLFRYRAARPRKQVRGSWGVFSIHDANRPDPIRSAEIPPVEAPGGEFLVHALSFVLTGETQVEVRVTGADAELWLDRAMFVPVSGRQAEESAK